MATYEYLCMRFIDFSLNYRKKSLESNLKGVGPQTKWALKVYIDGVYGLPWKYV